MIDKKMHKEVMGCFEMYLDEVDAMAKNDRSSPIIRSLRKCLR